MNELTRLRLLEIDADAVERGLAELRMEMKAGFAGCERDSEKLDAKIDMRFNEAKQDTDGTKRILVGLLVSVVLLCVGTVSTIAVAIGGFS
jgi:hypothetical protein